jgi:hypothetical protein
MRLFVRNEPMPLVSLGPDGTLIFSKQGHSERMRLFANAIVTDRGVPLASCNPDGSVQYHPERLQGRFMQRDELIMPWVEGRGVFTAFVDDNGVAELWLQRGPGAPLQPMQVKGHFEGFVPWARRTASLLVFLAYMG